MILYVHAKILQLSGVINLVQESSKSMFNNNIYRAYV